MTGPAECRVPVRVRLVGVPGADDLAGLEAAVCRAVSGAAGGLRPDGTPGRAGGAAALAAAAAAGTVHAPVVVGWDGPENPELRRRVEGAVAAGVRAAVAAAPPAPAAPPAVPDPAPVGDGDGRTPDPVAYRSVEDLRAGVRDAFPDGRGAARPGLFFGVYGYLTGFPGLRVYYVRPADEHGVEIIGSILLYSTPVRPRRGAPEETQRVPLELEAGYYTAVFRPDGPSELLDHDLQTQRPLANPDHLDLTVAFAVDPLHVVTGHTATWHYTVLTRIVAGNPVSPLATGAESVYTAAADLWEVDEYGRPLRVDAFATLAAAAWFHWEIVRLPGPGRQASEVVLTTGGPARVTIRHTWAEPGEYRVGCTVTVQRPDVSGRPGTDVRTERVVDRVLLRAMQLEAMERREQKFRAAPTDPRDRVWPASGAELIGGFEDELSRERAKPEPNQARIRSLEETLEKLRDRLNPSGRSVDAFPIHAVFMERRTSASRAVSLFLAFELTQDQDWLPRTAEPADASGEWVAVPYHWTFLDLTYPAAYRTYSGRGQTLLEGLEAAFHDSETSIRRTYPPGQILARVTRDDLTRHGITVPPGFPPVRDFVIETDSWEKTAWDWFTLGVSAVGLLALPGAFVFPALAPVLVLTTLAGAALSVASLADRVTHGDFDWDTETFTELLTIAAALAQVGALAAGARTSALAGALGTAEELPAGAVEALRGTLRVQRAVLITQLGLDVGNGLVLGYATYRELDSVDAEFDAQSLQDYQRVYGAAEGHLRWVREREARIAGIFANAVFNGTLIAASVTGGVGGLRSLNRTVEGLGRLGGAGSGGGGAPPPSGGGPAEPTWASLRELERAARTDKEAANTLNGYHQMSQEKLLLLEADGDAVATGLLNRLFGRGIRPDRPIDPALRDRLRTELVRLRAEVEAERTRRRTEQERRRAEGERVRSDPKLKPGEEPEWEKTVPTRAGRQPVVPTAKERARYPGTVAVAVTNIPALRGEVFEGRSPFAFGEVDPAHPVRPPETMTDPRSHGHAEQEIGQRVHDRLAALSPQDRAAASGGTVWMLVDEEVCGPCAAGIRSGERSGVVRRLSELNPDITFVITAEDTSTVLRLRAGEEVP